MIYESTIKFISNLKILHMFTYVRYPHLHANISTISPVNNYIIQCSETILIRVDPNWINIKTDGTVPVTKYVTHCFTHGWPPHVMRPELPVRLNTFTWRVTIRYVRPCVTRVWRVPGRKFNNNTRKFKVSYPFRIIIIIKTHHPTTSKIPHFSNPISSNITALIKLQVNCFKSISINAKSSSFIAEHATHVEF